MIAFAYFIIIKIKQVPLKKALYHYKVNKFFCLIGYSPFFSSLLLLDLRSHFYHLESVNCQFLGNDKYFQHLAPSEIDSKSAKIY